MPFKEWTWDMQKRITASACEQRAGQRGSEGRLGGCLPWSRGSLTHFPELDGGSTLLGKQPGWGGQASCRSVLPPLSCCIQPAALCPEPQRWRKPQAVGRGLMHTHCCDVLPCASGSTGGPVLCLWLGLFLLEGLEPGGSDSEGAWGGQPCGSAPDPMIWL